MTGRERGGGPTPHNYNYRSRDPRGGPSDPGNIEELVDADGGISGGRLSLIRHYREAVI